MARVYADWESQATVQLRRDRLALFRAELTTEINRGVNSDGEAVNSAEVQALHASLTPIIMDYDKLLRASPTASSRFITPIFKR